MNRFLLLIIAVITLGATGCIDADYAARVNGAVISSADLEADLKVFTSNPVLAGLQDAQLRRANSSLQPGGPNTVSSDLATQRLHQKIMALMVEQEMRRRNLALTTEERAASEQALRSGTGDANFWDSLDAKFRAGIVDFEAGLNALARAQATPEGAKRFYDANVAKFAETCFVELVLPSPDLAAQLSERWAAGEPAANVFNTAAAAVAQFGAQGAVPSTPPEPTCSPAGALSPAEQSALAAVSVNGVTQPVRAAEGYSVKQVISRRQIPFEEAQPLALREVSSPESVLSELAQAAKVKVHPRYGKYLAAGGQTPYGGVGRNRPVVLTDDNQLAEEARQKNSPFGGNAGQGFPVAPPNG